MFAEEWPLLIFTLISQLAIGSFLMLVLVRFSLDKQDATAAAKLTNPGFKAVWAVMTLALVFSTFHLGTPTGAYRSILNLGSSWLSREIVSAGGFWVFSFLSYRAYQKEQAGHALAWLTSLIGLCVVLTMASIYSHSIRPAWTNANTYIAFYGATFALGGLGASALIVFGAKGTGLSSAIIAQMKKISLIAGVAVILPLLYLPIYINTLAGGSVAAQLSAQLLTGSYKPLLILSALVTMAGAALLGYTVWRIGKNIPPRWVYIGLVLVILGEFLGRLVFYGTAVSIMIGLN
ncbi:MAG: dimethyl sulfoxide reductase anchor subunit [Negativicutes bacterium]|nr:dimethyl sulfoxide reductase anchor subunit [Negativicutes bacterium]